MRIPEWGTGKVWMRKAGLSMAALLLFFLCAGLLYMTKSATHQRTEQETLTAVEEVTDVNEIARDYWTFSIFGVDGREQKLDKGNNADAILLCTIEKAAGEVRLISVGRDTYLQTKKTTREFGKLGNAYKDGGPDLLVEALNENLDLNLSNYVTFSWKAAAEAASLLGGTDIELSDAEFGYINSFITETVKATGVPSSHLTAPGMNHLDGVQTVAYCRLRLMDSDHERTKRQRKVMGLLLEMLRNTDLTTQKAILEAVMPGVETNIPDKELVSILLDISKFHIVEEGEFPFEYQTAAIGRKGMCNVPFTLVTNVKELHRLLYCQEEYECPAVIEEIGNRLLKEAVGYTD